MRKIHLVLLLLLITLSSSCASRYISSKKIMEVAEGMSQQDIRQMIGKPDFRRFDGGLEEWEYRRDQGNPLMPNRTTIVIRFVNGQVSGMNTYSGYGVPARH